MLLPEPAPAERKDYDYAGGDSAFERTTLEAFKEAGAEVSSFKGANGYRGLPDQCG